MRRLPAGGVWWRVTSGCTTSAPGGHATLQDTLAAVDAQSLPRLTDQARVAVLLARSLPAPGPDRAARPATVAHLVAALAGEPEGIAGIRLRQQSGEVAARVASHPFVAARSLPPLDTVNVALPVQDRPVWTLELLHAAVRVGGEDLAHLLGECGVAVAALSMTDAEETEAVNPSWMPCPSTVAEGTVGPETYGLGSLRPDGYSAEADRAVAITRALSGDSHDLLRWIDPDDETAATLLAAEPSSLQAVLDLRAERGGTTGTDDLVVAITHLSIRAALR